MRNPWRASGERMSQTKRLETIHPLVNIDNLAGKSIHDGPKAILVFSLNRLPGLLRLPRRLKRKELKRKRCNGPRKQLLYSWMDLLEKGRNREWRVPVTHSSPSAARLHSQSPQAPRAPQEPVGKCAGWKTKCPTTEFIVFSGIVRSLF